jgi:regulatory protein
VSTQPQDAVEDALARCYRHLGRREHSTAELRTRLEGAGLPSAAIEDALATVTEQGYLDDARYARLLVEDRQNIAGWGAERIRERLRAAGIERELIDEVLSEPSSHAAQLAAARALLERRCPGPFGDNRARQRAFGILIRLGYSEEIAYEAIRAAGDSPPPR